MSRTRSLGLVLLPKTKPEAQTTGRDPTSNFLTITEPILKFSRTTDKWSYCISVSLFFLYGITQNES